jgi:hypothetical protein
VDEQIIDEQHEVLPCGVHSIPPVQINRIVRKIVRPSIGIAEGDPIAPIVVKKIVDDEGVGVAPGNRDPTVTRRTAIANEAVALDMNPCVLVVATHQGDRRATRADDRETTDGDVFGLLEFDGVAVGALRDRPLERDAANSGPGVSFNKDMRSASVAAALLFLP